jgi:hypothetical protein
MTKFIFVLVIMTACFGVGFGQSGKQATAQEKKDLFAMVQGDKNLAERAKMFDMADADLMKMMKVTKMDLNKDGKSEYMVVVDDGRICGALANCPSWIYASNGSGYKLLLSDTASRGLSMVTTSTAGYRDIESTSGDTAILSHRIVYKYDGSMYQANKCYDIKKGRSVSVKCTAN